MRYLKRLTCGVAVGALLAFAAPAEATTLTSPAGTLLGPGVTTHIKEKNGKWKIVVQNMETVMVECNKFTVHMDTTNQGSTVETIDIDVTQLKQEECTRTTTTLKPGTIEIHKVLFSPNATMTWKGQEITVNTIFGSCVWGTGTGTNLGTLVGGSPATVNLEGTLLKVSGSALCPSSVTLTAEYEMTSPTSLFVDE